MGTVWSKYQHIIPGDTWNHTEVDSAGIVQVSTVEVENCSTYLGTMAYLLITRFSNQGSVVEKLIPADFETILYRIQDDYLIAQERVITSEGDDPLSPGFSRLYIPEQMSTHPNYLGYNPDIISVPTPPYSVRLAWIAPAYDGTNWSHYRIYRNQTPIADIPFSQSEYTDTSFLANETTYYEVRATNGEVFSDPSNWVLVMMVGVEDELISPVQISVSPNPAAISQGGKLQVKFSNLQNREADLAVYNVKGQLVMRNTLKDCTTYEWQGLDNSGKRCTAGIYFIKAHVRGEATITRKIVLY